MTALDRYMARLEAVPGFVSVFEVVGEEDLECGGDDTSSDGMSDSEDPLGTREELSWDEVRSLRHVVLTERRVENFKDLEAFLASDVNPAARLDGDSLLDMFRCFFQVFREERNFAAKFDIILAFTLFLYVYDDWLRETLTTEGDEALVAFALAWKSTLALPDEALGIFGDDFTRKGVEAFLDSFRAALYKIDTKFPYTNLPSTCSTPHHG